MMEQLEVIAVRRNKADNYTSFRLSDGQVIDYQQAVQMAYDGRLKNVDVSYQNGQQVLRSGILVKSYEHLPEMTT